MRLKVPLGIEKVTDIQSAFFCNIFQNTMMYTSQPLPSDDGDPSTKTSLASDSCSYLVPVRHIFNPDLGDLKPGDWLMDDDK